MYKKKFVKFYFEIFHKIKLLLDKIKTILWTTQHKSIYFKMEFRLNDSLKIFYFLLR